MEILRSFAKGSNNNPLDTSKSCKLGLDWTGPVVPGAVPQFSWSVVQAFLMYSFSSLALLSTALVASCPCRWGVFLVFELLILSKMNLRPNWVLNCEFITGVDERKSHIGVAT